MAAGAGGAGGAGRPFVSVLPAARVGRSAARLASVEGVATGTAAIVVASLDGNGLQTIDGPGAIAFRVTLAGVGTVDPFARARAEEDWMMGLGLDPEQDDLFDAA